MKLSPTPLSERIGGLDFLRGVALLGIFIANMLHFHSPYAYMDGYSWFTAPSEEAMFHFIDIFIEASFYPLFAMLFGYGMNLQYEKAMRDGKEFSSFMFRRLFILMIFGILHATLVWSGDILFTYAAMGLIMIALIRLPAIWLFSLGLFMYTVPAFLMLVLSKIARRLDPNSILDGYVDIQQIELAISAYAHGTFGEILAFRVTEFVNFEVVGLITSVFMILPLLMFGAALSKWKVMERMYTMKKKLLIAMVLFISAGLALKMIPYWYGTSFENVMIVQSIYGGAILAAGYAALLMLLYQIPFMKIITGPFSAAGRMAFTTYIMQSVIATLIFYSYGAGLYGKVDIETGTWLAIGIFLIQLIAAQAWLSKFRMGPLEAVWRKLSYGKFFDKKEEKL